MLFRQLFDAESSTYTYLIAGRAGGEALLIDPVETKAGLYLSLLDELGLTLAFAADTHIHADHVSALGVLRTATGCATLMGRHSPADCVTRRLEDNETFELDGLQLRAIFTPGHTGCSICLVMADRVFTGDTLLIRGTGRTDLQGGDAAASYRSIVERLLTLPDETLVYPGHDYRGCTVSTIGEERRHNSRLQVADAAAYVAVMGALDLPYPAMMDVAVSLNRRCGRR